MSPRIGIDVGGVIIRATEDENEISMYGENFRDTPAMEGAVEGIRQIVTEFGPENCFIVSKCGQRMQVKIIKWMVANHFTQDTGMQFRNIFFCLKRAEKAKFAEIHKFTHFIDDRLEVLTYLPMVEHRFLFKPKPEEVAKYAEYEQFVDRVESWDELLKLVLFD